MKHDHVLKKLNLDLLTPYQWLGPVGKIFAVGGGLQVIYLLPCFFIRDYL